MRTDFTPISNALDALVDEIANLHRGILAKANAERVEALALFAKMNETKADLEMLAGVVDSAAEQLDAIADVSFETAELVGDAIEGIVPECDYEDFAGYCGACGATITRDDEFHDDEHGIFCATCAERLDDEPADEPADEDESDEDESVESAE